MKDPTWKQIYRWNRQRRIDEDAMKPPLTGNKCLIFTLSISYRTEKFEPEPRSNTYIPMYTTMYSCSVVECEWVRDRIYRVLNQSIRLKYELKYSIRLIKYVSRVCKIIWWCYCENTYWNGMSHTSEVNFWNSQLLKQPKILKCNNR